MFSASTLGGMMENISSTSSTHIIEENAPKDFIVAHSAKECIFHSRNPLKELL